MNITAIELKEINPECNPGIGPKCPYCNSVSKLWPASFIYGDMFLSDKNFWVCKKYPTCNSYVGTHSNPPFQNFPMGSLADRELRETRLKAHTLFDHFWKSKVKTRNEMYKWFQKEMELDGKYAHIGELNLEQCLDLIWKLNQLY